jgi:hypothetical protein
MFVCDHEPVAAIPHRPEPPTRQAIEQHRQKQLDALRDLRRKLVDSIRSRS